MIGRRFHRNAALVVLMGAVAAASEHHSFRPCIETEDRMRFEPPPAGAGPSQLLDDCERHLRGVETDGDAWSVLFGLPTEGQRQRVHLAATQAATLCERASLGIMTEVDRLQESILDLPRDGNFSRDSLAMRERVRLLIDQERNGRVPLVRGMANVLTGASDWRRPDFAVLDQGIASLKSVTLEWSETSGETEARRRLYLGAGLLARVKQPTGSNEAGDILQSILDDAARLGHPIATAQCEFIAGEALGAWRALPHEVMSPRPANTTVSSLLPLEMQARSRISESGRGTSVEKSLTRFQDAATERLGQTGNSDALALIDDKIRWALGDVERAVHPALRLAAARSLLRSAESAQGELILDHLRVDAVAPIAIRAMSARLLGRRLADRDPLRAAALLCDSVAPWPTEAPGTTATGESDRNDALQALREATALADRRIRESTSVSDTKTAVELALRASELMQPLGDATNAAQAGRSAAAILVKHWPMLAPEARSRHWNWIMSGAHSWAREFEASLDALMDVGVQECEPEARLQYAQRCVDVAREVRQSSLGARLVTLGQLCLEQTTADASPDKSGHRAVDAFRAALDEVLPDRVPARLGLGMALRRTGDVVEARNTLLALVDEIDGPVDQSDSASRRPEFWVGWVEITEMTLDTGAKEELTWLVWQVRRLEALDPEAGGSPDLRERLSRARVKLEN